MAVVYSGEYVFTEAELGYNLTTNASIILAISSQQQHQQYRQDSGHIYQGGVSSSFTVAFSRPIGGAGTVRLVASGGTEGLAAARELKTTAAAIDTTSTVPEGGAEGGVVCHTDATGQHIIDLQLPDAPGRTAQGSCVIVW